MIHITYHTRALCSNTRVKLLCSIYTSFYGINHYYPANDITPFLRIIFINLHDIISSSLSYLGMYIHIMYLLFNNSEADLTLSGQPIWLEPRMNERGDNNLYPS